MKKTVLFRINLMKNKVLLFTQILSFAMAMLLLAMAGVAKASPVDVNTAREVGFKYMRNCHSTRMVSADALRHVDTYFTSQGTAALYVFNMPKGFVIVAADDCAHPVLGYSTEGQFDREGLPIQMEGYLNDLVLEIGYGIEHQLRGDAQIAEQWRLVLADGVLSPRRGLRNAVEPLLTEAWSQDCGYNAMCPEDVYGPCGHALVGCVATAMGQIMHYWGHPTTGQGSHTYFPSEYDAQTADFGATTYNWALMPDHLSAASTDEEIEAVATLLWHCGISVDMNYGSSASSASHDDVSNALVNYFKYDENLYGHYRSDVEMWLEEVKTTLDKGRPIFYTGRDTGGHGGHAFVCDGYDADDLLHFNWGWSGNLNGYFVVDALDVSFYHFNNSNYGIFEIFPICNPTDQYLITAIPSSSELGTVTGAGTYGCNETCVLTAVPKDDNVFMYWKENNHIISRDATISFVVREDRSLTAVFAAPDQQCSLVFQMYDRWGDGWNGNQLRVKTDNESSEIFTMQDGYYQSFTYSFFAGSTITLSWIAGDYIAECSFNISFEDGVQIYHAENLYSGFSDSITPNCADETAPLAITLSVNLEELGTVTGGGAYSFGETCTVTAMPQSGCSFLYWMEKDMVVSYDASYSFTVTNGREFKACFTRILTAISDDFNDGEINPNYWTASGSNVIEADGMIQLQQNVNNDYVALESSGLLIPSNNKIVMYRKFLLHEQLFVTDYGNRFFFGKVTFGMYGSDYNCIEVDYYDDDNDDRHGTYIRTQIDGNVNETRICDVIFDDWLTEVVTIDLGENTLSYYRDNEWIATIDIPEVAPAFFTVRFKPEGWLIGHYHNMDYVMINQEVTSCAADVAHLQVQVNAPAYTEATVSWTSENDLFELKYRKEVENSFTEDFENGIPSDWVTIDADGDGYNWMLGSQGFGSGYGHNGSSDMVFSQSWAAGTVLYPDNYLVTPQLSLGGTFSFWACAQDAAYPSEHFGVAISTGGQTDPSSFTTIQEWTMTAKGSGTPVNVTRSDNRTQGNWYQYIVDLNDYAGQEGYIAIRHFNSSDMFYLNVDDVSFSNSSVSEWITITDITETSYTLSDLDDMSNYFVQVRSVCDDGETYSNWSSTSFTNKHYTISVSADPAEGGSVSGSGTYLIGDDVVVEAVPNDSWLFVSWTENDEVIWYDPCFGFSATVDRNLVARFTYDCSSDLENLQVQVNAPNFTVANVSWASDNDLFDLRYGSFSSNQEGFENGIPDDWVTIDADGDGYTWGVISDMYPSNTGHESMNCAASQSYNAGVLYPDNYLVLPQCELGGTLSFWACAYSTSYVADHFGVAVSTGSQTDASDFVTVQEWTMTAKNNGAPMGRDQRGDRQGSWYYYTVDLSAFAGQTGYLAIRHFNCYDQWAVFIDDIEYKTSINDWTYINGITETSYSLTGLDEMKDYIVQVRLRCGDGESYSDWVEAFFTTIHYTISVAMDPEEGGVVYGGGEYCKGTPVTLQAEANPGYVFVNWTYNGEVVSTEASYTFVVDCNRDLVAHYQTVLNSLSDDFNDGEINPEYWVAVGSNVYESDGLMHIEQNVTDDYVRLTTHSMMIPESRKIVMNRSFLVHNNNAHFSGGLGICFGNDEDNYLRVAYWDEHYTGKYGTYIDAQINGETSEIWLCDAVFDTWIEEKIEIDLAEGTLSYYNDNELVATATVNGLSALEASCFNMYFWPYDWWTGSYQYMDYININVDGGGADIVQTFALSSGWCWMSSYLECSDELFAAMKDAIAANNSTAQIKNMTDGLILNNGSWQGTAVTLTNEGMLMTNLENATEVTLTAASADPSEHPIILNPGWNWIGFISSEPMTLNEALSGIVPNNGDQIKDMSDVATYSGTWTGTLVTLQPGNGYMYYNNGAAMTLVFPAAAKGVVRSIPVEKGRETRLLD